MSLFTTLSFYILVSRRLKLKEAYKLICVASALNRLLFSGLGFVASSFFSHNKNLSFSKALGVFFILEFLGVFLWIILGIYFGAKLAVKIYWIFWIILIIFLGYLFLKRREISLIRRRFLDYSKEVGRRIFYVFPFILINAGLYFLYYFFLFSIFGFSLSNLKILEIISISFTVGYLSPSPAGLGFRDTGLTLLLMDSGISLGRAIFCAVTDRVIVTFFWTILGLVMGYDLIKEEIERNFKKLLIFVKGRHKNTKL
jgi:uncharacterized membrane protein YbhN (UPF0104 family)